MQREQTAAAPAPVTSMPEIAEHEPAIKPNKAKRLYMIIAIAVVALLLLYGIYALITSGKEATDDAQVSADVVPVAARIAGQVVNVYIQENQLVHRGDRIADIDPSDARVKVAQGQADLQSSPVAAQVTAAQAQAQLAHARVQTAQAALQSVQLSLSYTSITAPADGLAARLSVHPGSYVTVGQAIVQIVPRTTYVIANFKETQLKAMRPGQRASIKVDALGGRSFDGHIDSLSGGTGATFSMLPPDNASGNFVKVVQRVPVRIAWNGPPADVVPAGSSAEVTVYTK